MVRSASATIAATAADALWAGLPRLYTAVAAAGLRSESEGEEPNRRVVVLPAG